MTPPVGSVDRRGGNDRARLTSTPLSTCGSATAEVEDDDVRL